jgi:CubicO group peptidase (beta-lactamase class C family)
MLQTIPRAAAVTVRHEPLGMNRSSYTWQTSFESNYADPHDADMAPGRKIKPSTPNAAASLQTTADDYARFLEAVVVGAGLQRDTACHWLDPQVHMQDAQIAWGLGWGLEASSGAFFQWGDYDQGRFKAFAIGSLEQRCAAVVFTNGFNGMAIMPELIGRILPGPHPAFAWLGYPVLRDESTTTR